MSCYCPSNPTGASCWSNKRVAVIGSESNYSASHTSELSVALALPDVTVDLNSRTRNFSMFSRDKTDAACFIACQMAPGTEDYAANVEWAGTSAAELSEEYVMTRSTIRYLDLRAGVVVYQQAREEIPAQKLTDQGQIGWNEYGTVVPVHKMGGRTAFAVNTSVTELVDGDGVYEHDEAAAAEIDEVITIPPTPGQPQEDLPDSYHLYSESWGEDGGYDLYYPAWLRNIGFDRSFDEADRDLHLELETAAAADQPLTSPVFSLLTATDATGSWAVAASGDRFYSQKHPGGCYNYLSTGDATALVALGANPRFYPIAPL